MIDMTAPAAIARNRTIPCRMRLGLTDDSPSERYAFDSATSAAERVPSNQQRTIAIVVSPKISGHSARSAACASSSISGANRALKLEG